MTIEAKLNALIEVLGYECEEVPSQYIGQQCSEYKITKRIPNPLEMSDMNRRALSAFESEYTHPKRQPLQERMDAANIENGYVFDNFHGWVKNETKS